MSAYIAAGDPTPARQFKKSYPKAVLGVFFIVLIIIAVKYTPTATASAVDRAVFGLITAGESYGDP